MSDPSAPAQSTDPATPTPPVAATDPAAPAPTDPTTQGDPAALGDAGKRALDAERAQRTAAERQARELKARLDEIEAANLSDLEKAQRERDALAQQLQTAQQDAARSRVALEKGIPSELLSGATPEEMTASADRLIAWRGTAAAASPPAPPVPQPDSSQGARGTTPSEDDVLYTQLFGPHG